MKVIVNGLDLTPYGLEAEEGDGLLIMIINPILEGKIPGIKATKEKDAINITADLSIIEKQMKKNNLFKSLKFKGKTIGKNLDGEISLETQIGNLSYDTKTQAVGFEGEIKL